MRPLNRQDLLGRLGHDYAIARRMRSESLGQVRAFASARDISAGRDVSPDEGRSGRAAHYFVEYRFPHLVGPGPTGDRAGAVFDLLSGGNYPATKPLVTFVTRPLPWSSHIQPGSGSVCLGEGWSEARGQMLLAELIVHVMRLMNFDEPDSGEERSFNPEALRYWRMTMRCRPFLPGLAYPTLPSDLTHGVANPAASFRRASEVQTPTQGSGRFATLPQSGFRPVSR